LCRTELSGRISGAWPATAAILPGFASAVPAQRGLSRVRLTIVEPVYGTIVQLARLTWRLQGLRFTVTGVENLPAAGGAVIAINHTSYFDFTFAGLPAYKQGGGRKVRFMAKQEVFEHKISGPLMRGCRHIPVDRDRGAASFDVAVQRLKAGELVGVYPEATISRSFEIKELKSGAARMAIAAGVPIIPHIVWGAQRIWTKDHPKKLYRPKVPIAVTVGEPILPTLPASDLTTLLHSRMQHLLERVQDSYGPHPAGEFWVPHRLGGAAPSLAEAARLDAEEARDRAAARAAERHGSDSVGTSE
jgi:1-acyl-sn-glycerol-3-phosphate acyltransferase